MSDKNLFKSKGGITLNGKVKWFDSTKGIGFIQTEEGNDVFVHVTGIQQVNGKTNPLKADQRVQFEIMEGKRGPQATNVKVVE